MTKRRSASQPEILTTSDAAVILGIKARMVQRYCQRGRLTAQRHGKRGWILKRADVDAFAKQPRKKGGK